jgi:hypothetical protein
VDGFLLIMVVSSVYILIFLHDSLRENKEKKAAEERVRARAEA